MASSSYLNELPSDIVKQWLENTALMVPYTMFGSVVNSRDRKTEPLFRWNGPKEQPASLSLTTTSIFTV